MLLGDNINYDDDDAAAAAVGETVRNSYVSKKVGWEVLLWWHHILSGIHYNFWKIKSK